MKKKPIPTPEELAAEAREVPSQRQKRTPDEYITEMVRRGFINAKGEVTRLIDGSAEPEPNYETWTPEEYQKKVKNLSSSRPADFLVQLQVSGSTSYLS